MWIKPTTDELHNLAVQGPESRDLMRKIVWNPPTQPALDDLKWFRFLVGRIGSYDGIPIVVSRTATPASSGTRSGATPTTARRCGTRSGRPDATTA